MNRVGKLCYHCNRIYYTGKPRCDDCERKRSASRPWYRTEAYLEAKRIAANKRGATCPKCRIKMKGKEYKPSVDHITPIAAGGSWYGPFQTVCLRCNLIKGSKVDGF